MVYVESGTFQMGCTDEQNNCFVHEKPVHGVTVSSFYFYISKYEITQLQWRTIMDNNPSEKKADNYPVTNVNYNDAGNDARVSARSLSEPEFCLIFWDFLLY